MSNTSVLFDQDGGGNLFPIEKLPLFQKAAVPEKVRGYPPTSSSPFPSRCTRQNASLCIRT